MPDQIPVLGLLAELSPTEAREALGSSSLERLYVLLREAHEEVEVREHELSVCEAVLAEARTNLDKARHLRDRVRGKAADIDAAIIDRRRAERGIAVGSPPTPTDPETGAPRGG